MKRAALVLLLAIAPGLLIQVRDRGIDPDELEHIHASCAVSWGEVPYRDFFEHHGPALYYLLQPVLRATGPEPSALAWSRLLMALAGLATLAVTGATAYRLSGLAAALAAPILLGCTSIFFWKAIEVRPDVPAMLLIAMAAHLAIPMRRCRPHVTALAVGVLLGTATLFTQKAIVPAAALICVSLATAFRRPPTVGDIEPTSLKTAAISFALALLGAAAAWLVAICLFSTVGAAGAFLDSTVVQLWRWPVRENALTALRPTLAADLTLWIGLVAAVVALIHPAKDGDDRQIARAMLAATVLLCFVGGLLAKAAYAQYYLLWFPLAAVVAADWLVRWGQGAITPRDRAIFFGILAMLAAVETVLATHAICRGSNGPLPHLLDRFAPATVGAYAAVLLAVVASIAGVCIALTRRAAVVACLAALALGYAGLRYLDALCWSNRVQMTQIEQVDRLVGPGEAVFDGFTGLGAFRHHAYYYWWLNPYSLRLMELAPREPSLLTSLERSPPKVVCVDENIKALPEVAAWIAAHYDPIEPPLYLRKPAVKAPTRGRAD